MSSYAIPTLLSVCCLTAAGFAAAAEPKRDVKYDTKHERKVLDFWPALKEGEPAPDFVFFHGGGFHNGDKSHLEKYLKPALYAHRKAGFAVVALRSMDKGETPLFLYSDAAPDDRIHPPWAVSLASPAPRMAANTTIFPRSRMAGGATGVLSQASHQLRKVSN